LIFALLKNASRYTGIVPRFRSPSNLFVVLASLAVLPSLAPAAAPEPAAAALARQIREAGLDPGECYKVLNLDFSREDLHVYFTAGYLIFGKPVNGVRLTAVFSAETEGGDAELLLMPPRRSERLSLSNFAHVPNLEEHFRSAVLVFTDSTAKQLMEAVHKQEAERGAIWSPEMGQLLSSAWSQVVRNLSESFVVRLVDDLFSPGRGAGMFYAALTSRNLGNFDLIYDPRAADAITVGQLTHRDNRSVFDIWTTFESRGFRTGNRAKPEQPFSLSDFRIDAAISPDLSMQAVTRVTLEFKGAPAQAFQFDISPRVRVTAASVDGKPAEVFARESLRDTAIRGSENEPFLLVAPHPLEAGRPHQVEVHHEGSVISDSGNGVYYVAARGAWYPHRGANFAIYDLTFRYPAELTLVSTGELVEEHTAQAAGPDVRVSHRRTSSPVRTAGFNLGRYEKISARRDAYTVEVYGNRTVETALVPKRVEPPAQVEPPHRLPRRAPSPPSSASEPPPPPDPTLRLRTLSTEVAAAFDFMTAQFGPANLNTLTVSPIPGTFGQGFPGLVYLSTLSYLNPEQRPIPVRDANTQLFFSDLLVAHEVAHQWWGNLITESTYHDEWLMEALANYSALLYLEKRRGTRALESVLDQYRANLVSKGADGRPLESTGPITWGRRLQGATSAEAWRAIVYEKGSWIIHMLRRRMGDAAFTRMLAELCKRYRFQALSTGDFERVAEEFLPPNSPEPTLENFFDTWVYDTGVPTLKVSSSVRGKAPALKLNVTVTQTGVPDDFSTLAPVEIQIGRGAPIVQWIRTAADPASFTLNLKQAPTKVSLGGVLALTK
jgi:hypothetical protein